MEAKGNRAHDIDGESEPYNGSARHARCADAISNAHFQYRCLHQPTARRVNVEGKLFVPREQIDRFWECAEGGEFAKRPRGASANGNRPNGLVTASSFAASPLKVGDVR